MVAIQLGLAVMALLATSGEPDRAGFRRYPAAVAAPVRPATPRIADPLSARYRSALLEAAGGPSDFAGHHVLAQVGCGAGCVRLAAIDHPTGRVASFPATISGWLLAVTEPISYRRDSRLLVVQGMLDEREPTATRRYLFDGRGFRPLSMQP